MGWTKVKKFFGLIDFQHTIFGLPFAYLGAFLALPGFPGWARLGWITLAMVGARTAALCMNRAIDLDIDCRNPRTAGWVLPGGELSITTVWMAAAVSVALLLFSSWRLNLLCLMLSPLALLALWGYSYTKRFTWWCHLILGLTIGIGPVGGWIAVTASWAWEPVLLMLAVGFWVGGFDAMYACQDIQFDRSEGLHSIPARFGLSGALRFARAFHLLTLVFFCLAGLAMGAGWPYYTGVVLAGAVLVYEHILVGRKGLEAVNVAAFKVNRYVSPVMFAAALLDIFGPW